MTFFASFFAKFYIFLNFLVILMCFLEFTVGFDFKKSKHVEVEKLQDAVYELVGEDYGNIIFNGKTHKIDRVFVKAPSEHRVKNQPKTIRSLNFPTFSTFFLLF